jgi:VIT1/CCC1 family predicted Fe2+/Mn2+ transporter
MMGVAGGGASPSTILLSGIAGLVAGACSMALGEWLSVTNALEMTRSQIDTDTRELHAASAWKRAELALLYEATGMPEAEARQAAERVIAQDPDAINTLIREERVLASTHMGNNPTAAAAYSAALFATGACVPVLPFLLTTSTLAFALSIALSLLALLLIGVATSFFNGRSLVYSGLRQVLIGAAAAALTHGVGRLFGAALG